MNIDLRKIPAVYMNLPQDTKKKEQMEALLTKCGFETILRAEGPYRPHNPPSGCAGAHYNGLCEIDPPFVLFEDDCILLDAFKPELEVPDNADAVYLGTSQWARYWQFSGPFVHYEKVSDDIVRTYNMLGGHSILYLTKEYVKMCQRITYHAGYVIEDYQDIGFAEVQRWFNVYTFDDPFFYQTSGYHGTVNPLTSYPTEECFNFNRQYFLPERVV